IYVAGGGADDRVSSAALFAYDPARDAWSERAPMSAARQHLASCALDGKMLVVGGGAETKQVTARAELYDPPLDRWAARADLGTARGGLGAAVLDGKCFVIGGEEWDAPLPATFSDNEAFDLASGKWSARRPMPTSRHGLGLAAEGGAIYAIG